MKRRQTTRAYRPRGGIRPSHVTLAVVVAVHVAAFYVFTRDGDPGGSATVSSADAELGKAAVNWQHVDSMVPDRGKVPPASAELLPADGESATAESAVPALVGGGLPTRPAVPVEEVLPPEGVVPTVMRQPEGAPRQGEALSASMTLPADASVEAVAQSGTVPGAVTSGSGNGFGEGANAGFDFGAYDLLITKEFHRAWVQPLGVDTEFRQNTARLAVKIRRDGTVERFSLAHLTGVPELDSSVLAAARSVRKIAPLPESYRGASYDVMINFQLD